MRLLVIRGDLQSQAGYSAAIRAYSLQLQDLFDRVVGVDIHFDKDRPFEAFPHPVVSESEARYLSVGSSLTLGLSITTPNHYARLPNAVNVGLTFWETDQFPQGDRHLWPAKGDRSPWIAHANRMDALWSASSYTKGVFQSLGVTPPISVIPWPLTRPSSVGPGLPRGTVYDLDNCLHTSYALVRLANMQARWFGWTRRLASRVSQYLGSKALDHWRASSKVIPDEGAKSLVCVAQDVPRKGLLLLLAEWLEFKRRPEADGWTLILKSKPYNPQVSQFDFVSRFWLHVQALKRQLGVKEAGVYLWTSDLSGPDFDRLVANSFGSIAPSFGEGFCGPAVLAISLNKPVVLPRHTAFADYVPGDYPYLFATRPVIGRFVKDVVGLYAPNSTWEVPEPFAVTDRLSRLVKDSANHRQAACVQARDCLANWCDPQRVRRLLTAEVERLFSLRAQVTFRTKDRELDSAWPKMTL